MNTVLMVLWKSRAFNRQRYKDYAFSNPDGSRIGCRFMRGKLEKAAKEAGLGHLSLHSLRHTFASHLVMSGVDLPTVQRLMGRKDIKATMIYAHLAPDHLRMGMAMLDFGGHYMDTKPSESESSKNRHSRKLLRNKRFKGQD